MTNGPRTSSSPSAPVRTPAPGTGGPAVPGWPGSSAEVSEARPASSVMPQPSAKTAPDRSCQARASGSPAGWPAESEQRSDSSGSPGQASSRRYIVGTPASTVGRWRRSASATASSVKRVRRTRADPADSAAFRTLVPYVWASGSGLSTVSPGPSASRRAMFSPPSRTARRVWSAPLGRPVVPEV